MRRIIAAAGIFACLTLAAHAPAFAQDGDEPTTTAANGAVYLPLIADGRAEDAAADNTGEPPPGPWNLTVGTQFDGVLPDDLADLALASPVIIEDAPARMELDPRLRAAEGKQRVVVRLREPSTAEAAAADGVRAASVDRLQAQAQRIFTQQEAVLGEAEALDDEMEVLGTTDTVLNSIILSIEAAALPALLDDPNVLSIHPVIDYELELSEVVPWIGADTVQAAGFTGDGVKVAVLDSGIDYLHASFGGSGDPADFAANDPDIIETGTFPTAKVVDGFDFVGSEWPNSAEAPDPDPLDDGAGGGHGTHVADMIGGVNGVAPDADLYAAKVCSSISPSCSGVALLLGMDWALDPNDDSDISDRVDIINLSLGSNYGQVTDQPLAFAVDNASAVGVLTVASAGNAGDNPFIVGQPAVAPSALAVAQTHMPSDVQKAIEAVNPAQIADLYPAVFQPWSATLASTIQAPLQYGNGVGGNLDGCAPFPPNSLAGKIVLVDRGTCNFTLKIFHIDQAGGLAGIIARVTDGFAFQGGDGGDGPITIPAYMITLADGNILKAGLPDTEIRLDPAATFGIAKHMVSTSSRGPAMNNFQIKPEIGAPGAAISAIAGTGIGTSPFSGTSGAAPIIAGSAALLKEAYPGRSVSEIKALLVNTGAVDIFNETVAFGGDLAPITRIGGGEVRVDSALASPIAGWEEATGQPTLSFGFFEATRPQSTLRKKVRVRNYGNETITLIITPTLRFQDDIDNGAVTISAPDTLTLSPGQDRTFNVRLTVDGAKLRAWTLNSGAAGADADLLSLLEYDGYVTLTNVNDAGESIHLPWHILPRKSTDVILSNDPGGDIKVRNRGVGPAFAETYALLGDSPNLPEGAPGAGTPTPDLRYAAFKTFYVGPGLCAAGESFILAFYGNTWERQTHANAPASYRIFVDTDQDGSNDYLIVTANGQLVGQSDLRNLVWTIDLSTNLAQAFFFTGHTTHSANTVMLLCAEQIGLNFGDQFDPIDLSFSIADISFGGPGDSIPANPADALTIAPFGDQYFGEFAGSGASSAVIDARRSDLLTIIFNDFGQSPPISPISGLLLRLAQGARGLGEALEIQIAP